MADKITAQPATPGMVCFAMDKFLHLSYLWHGTDYSKPMWDPTAIKSITCLTQVLLKEAITRSNSKQQSYYWRPVFSWPYGCSHFHHHRKKSEPRNCLVFQQDLFHRHSSKRISQLLCLWSILETPAMCLKKPRADKKILKQQSRKSRGLWKPSSRAVLLTKDSGRLREQTEKSPPKIEVSRLGQMAVLNLFRDMWNCILYHHSHAVYCLVYEGRGTTLIWGAAASKESQSTPSFALCSHCPLPPSLTHSNTTPVPISSNSTGHNCASTSVIH